MTTRSAWLLAATALVAAPAAAQASFEWGQRNTDFDPAFPEQFRAPLVESDVKFAQEFLAEGLTHPWGVEVLPGGGYLVTERAGRLRHVSAEGELSEPIQGLPEVVAVRQGGLLDVALGPDFEENRMIYWTYAKPMEGNTTATAAARGVLSEDFTEVTEVEDIFVQEPAVPVPAHFGSRIVFDGEGHAYITTGEHFTQVYRQYAQDLDKTFGKVVRVNLDGSTPEGNPFADDADAVDTIWTTGHRNIQGAYWWDGELWAIEHGPAGGDELNIIEKGENYGWPVVSYGEKYSGQPVGQGEASRPEFKEPVYFWDPVIAPGGMHPYQGEMFADWQGDLLIASLVPGGLVRLEIEDDRVTGEERLLRDIGRVRDVEIDSDGAILILTDKPDGALIRLTPSPMGG
jgi:glucose/arabinose dehydrogenase